MRALRGLALIGLFAVGVAATPQPATTPHLASTPAATPAATSTPPPAARPAATAVPATPAYRAYFNWYDNASPGMLVDNVHVVNTSASPVTGSITLGTQSAAFNLASGAQTFASFPSGSIGGPVIVDASAPVLATQRVTYFRSLSEVASLPSAGSAEGWWPWYDNASPGMIGDNIHVYNPDSTNPANLAFHLGSVTLNATVQPSREAVISLPAGNIGGPLHFTSDRPVIASQRVETATSFNELPAMTSADGGTALWSSWYDLASPGFSADNVHIVNVSGAAASVNVLMQGTNVGTFSLASGAQRFLTFPVGTIGGPLELTSDQPIIATQRVNYYDAFQETPFHPATKAAASTWFTWYDDASPCFIADNVHVTNPGPGAATGSATLPNQAPQNFSLAAGQEAILSWPRGTIGGPLHVTSSAPVVVDQRTVICPPPPPPAPKAVRKIVVSLSQQHLWAYDNGNLFLETDVTTGRPELPTPAGTYHIFYRATPYQMISPWPYGSPYWYASAWVSWVLEFIQGGYFLHDAPWRSWFGPGSQYGDGTHGCVNIPNDAMYAIWNWAQLGDEVDVVG